jgi:hypothetical protein
MPINILAQKIGVLQRGPQLYKCDFPITTLMILISIQQLEGAISLNKTAYVVSPRNSGVLSSGPTTKYQFFRKLLHRFWLNFNPVYRQWTGIILCSTKHPKCNWIWSTASRPGLNYKIFSSKMATEIFTQFRQTAGLIVSKLVISIDPK